VDCWYFFLLSFVCFAFCLFHSLPCNITGQGRSMVWTSFISNRGPKQSRRSASTSLVQNILLLKVDGLDLLSRLSISFRRHNSFSSLYGVPIVVKFRHFVATQDSPVQHDNMTPLGSSHALYSETQVGLGSCTSWLLTQLFEFMSLEKFYRVN
jgi:hypothetical protein